MKNKFKKIITKPILSYRAEPEGPTCSGPDAWPGGAHPATGQRPRPPRRPPPHLGVRAWGTSRRALFSHVAEPSPRLLLRLAASRACTAIACTTGLCRRAPPPVRPPTRRIGAFPEQLAGEGPKRRTREGGE
jgi:hypothetical protein